jgi:hypothetical protein
MGLVGKHKSGHGQVALAEKRRRALELRRAGATYDQIAASVGFAGRSGAYKAVMATLKAMLREPAEEVRLLELDRLDAMLLGLWAGAKSGDIKKAELVPKIMDRRAKLLGLDAPVKAMVQSEAKAELIVTDDARAQAARELAEWREQMTAKLSTAPGVAASMPALTQG